jgi:heat shock protein HslJ
MKRAFVILLTLVIVSACGAASTGGSLEGRTFLSTRVTDNGADRPLAPGTQIRLAFQGPNLSASAGCNLMSGTYRVQDRVLVATITAMTEMGCDDARFKQDDWLAAFLGSGPTLELTGNDLVLHAGGTAIALLDRTVADPDLPLVGPTWRVVSIVAGETAASVPDGVVATLTFTPDGRVNVRTGCNSGGAPYTTAGSQLQIGPLALTKRACIDPAATTLETAIVAVVGAGTVDYKIEASTLTLTAGGRGLGLSGAP